MAKICTISELNEYLKNMFDSNPNLNGVYVKGEISNYKFHSSGHHYMTLKDESSVIRAVMFKFDASKLKFRPESGMKIIAKGRVSVFPRDGQYQLYISDMIPDGVGALYVAFEQLKKRLSEEGLFDAEKKKPLPQFPKKIAVITSPTGAAVRDILRILKSRFPMTEVVVCPVLVQGPDAPEDIASMISYVNKHKIADLIITGRGGGSIEDLWGFNDERVAYAIYQSEIPVISAVGHEPDVTISDFVADVRAATPSNAAELAVRDAGVIKRNIKDYELRIYSSLITKLNSYKESIRTISEKKIMKSPQNYFQERRLVLDFLCEKLGSNTSLALMKSREHFARLVASLDAMSPLKVLSRGYSIASANDGRIIKNVSDIKSGEKLDVRVSDGTIKCTVD
ncbi:MAG: exodeoxyribonuclease VII large subunit [Oscillospiraceae bacterium]|nr:exodeoxyribonuclease VII large subunit [Oscillospiraceae bacterium]